MIFKGKAASPGIAVGPAFLIDFSVPSYNRYGKGDPKGEWNRFEKAAKEMSERLLFLEQSMQPGAGREDASIFSAQAAMLMDPEFHHSVKSAIFEHKAGAEHAAMTAAEDFAQEMEALDDPYLKARGKEIRFLTNRLIRKLQDMPELEPDSLRVPSILISRSLTVMDTSELDRSLILGFCIVEGGILDHTAIIARAMEIPMVVGVGAEILKTAQGAELILDGNEGQIVISPDKNTYEVYSIRKNTLIDIKRKAESSKHIPAVTKDGRCIHVYANISDPDGARDAIRSGAEGAGLVRTEFLFMGRSQLPDEESQFLVYKEIQDIFDGKDVVFRTLDVGSDKTPPCLELPHEVNPALGRRALRLSLSRADELLRPQLRAMLRASAGRILKLLLPMVSTFDELLSFRTVLEECRSRLEGDGIQISEKIQLGIMVETPAAVLMADRLTDRADFFSIGTNDLTQYTMAADRSNPSVSFLLDALQPALLRLISMLVRTAGSKHKPVSICGEAAGEILAVPVLIGLGITKLSVNPPLVPLVKQIIRGLDASLAEKIAGQSLDSVSPESIRDLVKKEIFFSDLQSLFPSD